MSYGNRGYDHGFRGRDDRGFEGRQGGPGGMRQERNRLTGAGPERRMEERVPRVTARYNRDYVAYDRDLSYGARGVGSRPRNPNMFTGDRPEQIGDFRMMRRPYTTISGTRTSRGATDAFGYDRDLLDRDREPRRR